MMTRQLEYNDLQCLAGNMWSLFHYIPIVISLFGSVSWPDNKDEDEDCTPVEYPGEAEGSGLILDVPSESLDSFESS